MLLSNPSLKSSFRIAAQPARQTYIGPKNDSRARVVGRVAADLRCSRSILNPSLQSKAAALGSLVLPSGALIAHLSLFSPMRVDDAFIFLRYADNLRSGNGLVFNLGERVEGFTSLGWVWIETIFLGLGLDGLTAAKAVGVLSTLVLIWATVRIAFRLSGSHYVSTLAGLLIAINSAIATASVNAMETAPFAAAIALALGQYLRQATHRDRVVTGLLCALAILLRPEGILFTFLLGTHTLLTERVSRWQKLAIFLAPILLIAIPPYVIKAIYFGGIFPNTLVAKVSRIWGPRIFSGIGYLGDYAANHHGGWALGCLAVLALRRSAFRLFCWICLPWLLYIVYTGGDWIPESRFLVPLVPIASLGMAVGLHQLWEVARRVENRARRRVAWVVVIIFALSTTIPGAVLKSAFTRELVEDQTRASKLGRAPVARLLKSMQKGTAALVDVGEIAYLSKLKVIDTGGLTDPVIAQMIHDSRAPFYKGHLLSPDQFTAEAIAKEALGRKPDFVVLLLNQDLRRAESGETEGDVGVAYRQDLAMYQALSKSNEYRYLCSQPTGNASPGGEWRYNVLIRKEHLHLEPVEAALAPARCDQTKIGI